MTTTAQPRWRWLKSGFILLALLLFNFYLEYRGVFEPFALGTYDWFQRPSLAAAQSHSPVVTAFLLGRTEEQQVGTARRSDEERILRLIQVVSCAHPAVIGVDWSSGTWSAAAVNSLKSGPAAQTPIVWARELSENGAISPVAGRVSFAPNWTDGVAAVKLDRDGAVRRYFRRFENGREAFSWSVAKAYCASPRARARGCGLVTRCGSTQDCEQQLLLNYRDGSDRINQFAAEAIPGLTKNAFDGCSALPQAGQNPFIKDQIVLIGDAERSDLHETPYGSKNGVAIMAHAIQSDLFEGGMRVQQGTWVYVLDTLCVVIVILVNRIPRPILALCLNVIAIPILALVFSYWAFRSFHHWFNFVPILGGVIIHQLYEQARDNRRLRAEVSELRRDQKSNRA